MCCKCNRNHKFTPKWRTFWRHLNICTFTSEPVPLINRKVASLNVALKINCLILDWNLPSLSLNKITNLVLTVKHWTTTCGSWLRANRNSGNRFAVCRYEKQSVNWHPTFPSELENWGEGGALKFQIVIFKTNTVYQSMYLIVCHIAARQHASAKRIFLLQHPNMRLTILRVTWLLDYLVRSLGLNY